MEELNRKTIDRAVLVGLNADCFTKEETATETTLDELEALLNTAGGECAGKVLQNKHTPDPRSFIGEGKAEEVRQLVLETGANMVIFDNDLTPSQTRTLEDILKTTVLDRSALILDIFAQRAKTREGKLQVELAQYQYYLPRLTVWNEEMGRLGGGIGTRGPGETQLETDKRYIRSRIQKLRENLELVRKTRAEQRRRRQKNELPVVALVGYTNAGKSTLLNALTGSDIPANNRLFDTLDTTTRHMAGEELFARLKPGAVVMNSSRGEVVDGDALLRSGHPCVLDVWEHEPHLDPQLLDRALLATPHVAGYSEQGKATATAMSVATLAGFFGLPLRGWYPSEAAPSVPRPIPWQEVCTTIGDASQEPESCRLKARPADFEAMRDHYRYRREYF